MQIFRAHVCTFCVLSIAFSLLSPGHADFSFNFSTGDTASNFFFLLSNTTSQPTFAAPFGTSGQFLILTRDKQQTAHAIWYRHMQFVDDGFNFTFQFRVVDRSQFSADGLAFVIQPASMGPFNPYLTNPPDYCPVGASPAGCEPNVPAEYRRQNNEPLAVGAPGAGLGYSGLAESLAVEFDLWKDLDNLDPDANHISFHNNGGAANNAEERTPASGGTQIGVREGIGRPGNEMWNGQIHNVRIEYKPLQKTGSLAGTCPVLVYYNEPNPPPTTLPATAQAVCGPDPPPPAPRRFCKCLSTMLPSINKRSRGFMRGYAWIGLTAATGANVQTHQVANLKFTGSPKVNAIVPWAGPIEGGTTMTIIGDNFRNRPGAKCIFGDISTSLLFINSRTASCVSPPSLLKQRHMVNLTIMLSFDDIANPDPSFNCPGFSQPTPTDQCIPYQSRVDRFYYYINPTVTRVRPHSGPLTGGTSITIEGSGFYPELMSISSCYNGQTIGTSQLIGALPLDRNVTDFSTTVTKVVCPVTQPAAVGLNTIFFSMNSQQPAINSPIPGYKDQRSNRFPMLSTGFFFYPIPRLDGIMPSGTSSDSPDDRTITVYGNFTITDDMTCTFDSTTVNAQYFRFDESTIRMYDTANRLQCDAPQRAWAYSVNFRLSLNGQQNLPNALQFRYDNTFAFLLMAGSVGLFGLLILGCCSYSCFSLYNMSDYRTLMSKEYLELTGKTRWRVFKDLLSARGDSERKELVKVLAKLKQVQPVKKFGSSRWANAAKRALEIERGNTTKTGWDKLLNSGESDGGQAETARSAPQSQEKKGKTGWTSIVKNTEEGSGPRARTTTATPAASKWVAAASAKNA